MSVWSVYRGYEAGPTGLVVRRFDRPLDDVNLLTWFRGQWLGVGDATEADQRSESLLGVRVAGFSALLRTIQESNAPVPATMDEVGGWLSQAVGDPERVLLARSHLQLLDREETESAWYLFDDTFLGVGNSANNVACLLQDDWQLPTGQGNGFFRPHGRTWPLGPPGRMACSTYLLFLRGSDPHRLSQTPGVFRIDGVSLPELGRYLRTAQPDGELPRRRPGYPWPFELLLLRAALADAFDLADALAQVNQMDVVEVLRELHGGRLINSLDWVRDRLGEILHLIHDHCHTHTPRRDPTRSLLQAGNHVAQLCLHEQFLGAARERYQRWILFDDYWASAHPVLAQSLLRFAARWDVL